MTVFNSYAKYYDLFYREKNYQGEVDYVDALVKRYATNDAQTVLDLGCGTGGHAVLLAHRGYQVTGIDRSDAMLAIAKEKQRQTGGSVEFLKGDICTAHLDRSFDAAIAMFAVIGYQTTNDRLESALVNAWHHLNRDGLLIFDAWFGPAVIAQKPRDRVFIIGEGADTVMRLTRPSLDVLAHTVSVNFTVLRIADDRALDLFEEEHVMRFFFPKELEYMFGKIGFEVLGMHPFMALDGNLTENDWNMAVIARKITQ